MQTDSMTSFYFSLPTGYLSHDIYLKHLVREGALQHYTNITKEVQDRIDRELSIIEQLGFAKYYLVVNDILRSARAMSARVGPGRGNAAGSIIAFCLNITAMDPLEYGLLFERVLNPNWETMPDIDSDIDLESRPRVIDYVKSKFNGKVIITNYDEVQPTQPDVLAVDIIGNRSLSILKKAVDLIRTNHDKSFGLEAISINDHETFSVFQTANTDDIPFFDGTDIKGYLQELKPALYKELVALYALHKSGMSTAVKQYVRQKSATVPVMYNLPILKEVLGETYGVLIYQEQIMLLSQQIAGFSREESDRLRRVLQKRKNEGLRPAFKRKFIDGGKNNRHDEQLLTKTWDEWETRGECLFNKSHAVSFVLISFWAAFIKCHYPREFYNANALYKS